MVVHRSPWLGLLAIIAAILALPFAGAALAGRDLPALLRFPPPLQIPTDYPRFSWIAAALVLGTLALLIAPWLGRWRKVSPTQRVAPRGRFPGWGWFACAWLVAWWVLAWTRWSWFAGCQRYTFFPLWLGFIVAVNALTLRRAGTCLLLRHSGRWLALFGASAIFWWAFEWLNRFVRNWHYLAVEDFGPVAYAAHGTLCFSTVLPAVAAVSEWLMTFPSWTARVGQGPVWPWLQRKDTAACLLAGGGIALAGVGLRPDEFYPALWTAPLALLMGAEILSLRQGCVAELAAGDWRRGASWMTAALLCGFCWELWNWHSLAKWIYTVPYADRWHLFEMPALGYAGYLPFGLECALVADRIMAGSLSDLRKSEGRQESLSSKGPTAS